MIQVVDMNQSYIPVAHADYLIININIKDIYRLTASIWGVSNNLHNKPPLINEIFSVITASYYLELFKIYYPNVLLN